MNPRERVLTAVAHKQPDITPVDLGGHRSSGIAAVAYARLRKHLGLEPRPVRVYDMVQQLAVIDNDVLDLFGVDVVEMGRGFLQDDREWKGWVLPDNTPCLIPSYLNVEKRGNDWLLITDDGVELAIQKQGCYFFEQTHFPMISRDFANDDFDDLPEILGRTVWTGTPHPGAHMKLDGEGLKLLGEGAARLRRSTDRAIVGLFGGNMFEIPQWLFRMDNYLMYMGLHPEAVTRFSEKLCTIHLANLEKWLGVVGEYIDIICFGDDLGSQNGSIVSPAMYRNLIKPYHAAMWKKASQLADVKVMLHCCGSIRSLLPDIIDAGMQIINPVQITCAGMDAAGLKKDFGESIVLWGGGCDTRRVLPEHTPEQIATHVAGQVSALGHGGGFVFQQVHNIMPDVPPENIEAMFRAIRK
jgi:uroporphyrinogen decarboxylase